MKISSSISVAILVFTQQMYITFPFFISRQVNKIVRKTIMMSRPSRTSAGAVVECKTFAQQKYYNIINNYNTSVVLCSGPAGCGKTAVAARWAAAAARRGDYDRVVVTTPTVSVDGEDIGYLPGDVNAKMTSWIKPIIEELHHTQFEIVPLGFMRGRTFARTIIIADEMQNATPEQTFMLLTRVGNDSKMILAGDLGQCGVNNSGLADVLRRHKENFSGDNDTRIATMEFTTGDIMRSPIVSLVYKLYSAREPGRERGDDDCGCKIDGAPAGGLADGGDNTTQIINIKKEDTGANNKTEGGGEGGVVKGGDKNNGNTANMETLKDLKVIENMKNRYKIMIDLTKGTKNYFTYGEGEC